MGKTLLEAYLNRRRKRYPDPWSSLEYAQSRTASMVKHNILAIPVGPPQHKGKEAGRGRKARHTGGS